MALSQLVGMPKLPLSSGFMSSAQKAPKGYVGAKELGPVYEELKGEEAEAERKLGQSEIDVEMAQRFEKGKEAEQKAKMYEQIGQEMQNLPERKALTEGRKELREMAFVPSRESAEDLAVLFSLMGVVGMVIGKNNAQQAMSAMNGMLEGHQKGRSDLYKKEKDVFDKNFKAMQAKVTTLEKELSEAMDIKKYDSLAREQKITMALANAENPPLLKALREKQGNLAVLNAVKGVRKDVDTLSKLQNDLQAKADDRQAKKDAIAAANERARLARLAADERARLYREQRERLAQAKVTAPKALKKGEFQANYISEIIGRPVDPDSAAKAAAGTMYKMQLKELADLNMKLGGAPGLKVGFVDYMNKFLTTKAGADGKFDVAELQNAYADLEKNDKSFRALSDNSKLLTKKELDSVMSYLQTKYGNRAPVAEFRAAQSVLNRSNMTPTAYNNVVNAQIKDTDNRLTANGFTPRDILQLNKHFLQNRTDLDLLSSVEDDVGTEEGISPYAFETEAEAEEFLEAVGLQQIRAKVGNQVGTVTRRKR